LKSPSELSLRSFALSGLRLAALALLSVGGIPSPVSAASLPDRAGAEAILEHFRQSIWAEPIFATFDLRQMPRRGDEHVAHGRFWGARNENGPVTRIEIDVGKGGFTHHILIQGGPVGNLWTSDGPGAGLEEETAGLAPLVPGSEMSPFDILPMPYLYWLDYDLSAVVRIRGRPSFTFVFTPPADFSAKAPAISSIRAYLDTQYDALVQSETVGPHGNVSKTLSLLELRKVRDRWIPKDIDIRNEATRDKTRLSLTAVLVGVQVDPAAFEPSLLGAPLQPPEPSSLINVSQ
jgi:hypothetical protein